VLVPSDETHVTWEENVNTQHIRIGTTGEDG